ncbi:Mannosylglycerate hydrolase [Listeria monocytogenes]|nr:Mannosylglycerate hydrolase [Listeria monocytogenes]
MKMAKTKVHVIPHSHWDREWYFTSSRSTIYLVKHLKEVIETLEAKDDYHFYLMDAQSSLIEDYLRYCPEDKSRLEKLIAEKRLITGPWYTQTDQLVISQEESLAKWDIAWLLVMSRMHSGKAGICHKFIKNLAYRSFCFGVGLPIIA